MYKSTILLIILIVAALVGCGGSDGQKPAVDAAIDAAPDAPVTLDCQTYCTQIQKQCSDANAQYADTAHCLAACASFEVGASAVTDMSGNTLGCRIYHSGEPSVTAPAMHCIHAGPAGDLITAMPPAFCSGGDPCASFCALELMACGSLDAPLPGEPRDETGNPLYQYRNLADCRRLCRDFDKTQPYSTTASGDTLACRLLQTTTAAIAVTPQGASHCRYTGLTARGPCAAAPAQ